MSDYIKREDVLNLAEKGFIVGNSNYKSVTKFINDIPAANVIKPRKGKWIREEVQTKEFGRLLVVKCSKCKKNQTYRTKYCSNCGAEMEGVSQ